ncbi:MAG: hypothetical protein HY690_03940 [Chloroflexi bacterium]|nr:hypothetical protein [Chloroflexota bacterium]
MATLTLAQAIEQEQQAHQRAQALGNELHQRERELAELDRAFEAAGADPAALARLVSQRDGLELAIGRLRTRELELSHQRERARTARVDVERAIVGLHHQIEDAKGRAQRWAILIRESEAELAARQRQHALASERLAERKARLAVLGGGQERP